MTTHITITSDFLCPWCYLAEARLRKVTAECGDRVAVKFAWRPFELNPDMPAEGMDRKEYRSRKFGWERSLKMDAQLEALGKEEGVHFNFARIARAPNTRLAHRLHEYSAGSGRADDFASKVFEAYFEKGFDIGSLPVLLDLIDETGLSRVDAERFLAAGGGLDSVVAAEETARRDGVDGVPQIVIGPVVIHGAQPTAVMKHTLLSVSGNIDGA